MRILVLAPQCCFIDRGTPIDVDILVRALANQNHTVDLVTYAYGESRAYEGLTIHRAKTPPSIQEIKPGFSWKKLYSDFYLYREAKRLLRANKYDVIHAGEESVFFAMRFSKKFKVPYVYDLDSSIAQQMVEQMPYLKPLGALFNWLEGKAIRNAMATAPVCNALAELAEKQGASYITTLHDISQLTDDDFKFDESVKEKLGIAGQILLYVGNLQRYQGIDLLVEAFALVPKDTDIHLVIAGGSQAGIERYQQKAKDLGIDDRAHFIGHWPVKKLGQLLAQADILTAPRTKGINTPMKVFPYLHSGKAVLVTDLPTHSQILDSSVCELAPANPKGFAESIVKLATDETLRARLGAAGKRFVEENHTFRSHQDRVNRLYSYVEKPVKDEREKGHARNIAVT